MEDEIRVLHVDDDPDMLALARTFLEREHEDLVVVPEESPRRALERLAANGPFDCIVSDLEMAGVDGLELLRRVRAERPNVPFILFTGRGSEDVASQAISAGVTDYLQKTTGTEQYVVLANRIRNAVNKHRAERSLAESKRRFRVLIEHSSDITTILEADGSIQYMSPSTRRILGHDPETLYGESAFDYVHPADRDRVEDVFEEAIENPALEPTVEYRFCHEDGSWRVLESVGSNRLDGSAVTGFIVNSRDVTERTTANAELRETKRKIEALHDVAAQMEACTTTYEVYGLTVEAAERILEFDTCLVDEVEDDHLVPMAVSSNLPAEAYYERMPLDRRQNLGSETYRDQRSFVVDDLVESGYAPAQGDYRSALSVPVGERGVFQAVAPERDAFTQEDLEATELLLTHTATTVERVEHETRLRELRRATRRLLRAEDSTELYEIAMRTARDVLDVPLAASWERDGDVLRPVARTERTPEFEMPTFEPGGFGWEVFADGAPATVEISDEWPELYTRTVLLLPLGEYGLLAAADPERSAYDDVQLDTTKILAANAEIALMRVDREDALHEQARQLERQNERLERFAGVVSHDLRNPLNVAQGNLEFIETPEDREHVERIERALARVEQIVDDVLTLAREGQADGETEPVDLERAVSLAESTVATDGVALRVFGDLGTVAGNENQLRTLFENLFRNSVEHGSTSEDESAPEGSDPAVTVTVGALADGFYVEDDGPGIPPERRSSVLEYGFSTSESGTGFGLAIVDQMVTALGWTVSVTEGTAGGARFEFRDVEFR